MHLNTHKNYLKINYFSISCTKHYALYTRDTGLIQHPTVIKACRNSIFPLKFEKKISCNESTLSPQNRQKNHITNLGKLLFSRATIIVVFFF